MNYNEKDAKRVLQGVLFKNIKQKLVYCLGGPNIEQYSRLYPRTVQKIISYETDPQNYIDQVQTCTNRKVILERGCISQSPIDINSFYDLDFCCTIINAAHIIEERKDCPFMVTLCTRNCKDTREKFFEAVGENIITIKNSLIETDKNSYLSWNYGHSPTMMVFFKN